MHSLSAKSSVAVLVLFGALFGACDGTIGPLWGHEPEQWAQVSLPSYRPAPVREARLEGPMTYGYPSDIPAAIANAWPNENVSTFSKTIDWGFEEGQAKGPEMSTIPGIFEVVSNLSAPFSPPWVLKSVRPLPAPDAGPRGGGIQMDHAPPNVNQLYLGLRVLANPEFEGGGNRLWVVISNDVGLYVGWSKTPGVEPDDGIGTVTLVNTDLDNCHISPDSHCVRGSSNVRNNGPGANLNVRRGRWNLFEAYLKVSSSHDARDGTVKWWLNGTLVGDYENVSLGASPIYLISYQQGWAEGFGGPQTREWFYLTDHMRLRY